MPQGPEGLDAFCLPATGRLADEPAWVQRAGDTAEPWLSSEIHLTRAPDAPAATHNVTEKRTRPSAGLMGVALAAKLCDSVRLYGFGNDSHPNSSNACRHYYDCKFSQRRYFSGVMGFHNWHHQWRVLSAWIERAAANHTTRGALTFVDH